MKKIEAVWAKGLAVLFMCASLLVFVMMALICVDVLLRNVAIVPGVRGLAWSNEVSEAMLYVITMLSAPWLLHKGQHIRVDIVLRMLPPKTAWYCEWIADALAFVCSVIITMYAYDAALASYSSEALTIKTLVTPEYWLLIPLPVTFLLLSIEILFRMVRLYAGPRAVRDEAVSAA
jgi:TRAP-type C4-dicarboxylate transport system permease small subunit